MELRAKLQDSRIIGRSHLTKIPVRTACIDSIELCVVKGIEGLEAQFDTRSLVGVSGMVLNRDRFKLKSPGPTTASFPALPKPSFAPPFHGSDGISKSAAC